MPPLQRREAIVAAAIAVAVARARLDDGPGRRGGDGHLRGLIHHYFDSMDDVLAAAFEQVARQDSSCPRG